MSAKPIEAVSPQDNPPCAGCFVSVDAFNEMRSDVREILVSIRGDEKLGHRGLAVRMAANETDISELKMDAVKARASLRVIGIISVGLASVISFAATIWKGK